MTGMDPWHTGILGTGAGQPHVANLRNTLPETLAAAGYHTHGVGVMHFDPQRALHGFHSTVLSEAPRGDFTPEYLEWFERNRPTDVGPDDHGIGPNAWMARPFHLPEHLHVSNWTASEAIRFLERRDPTRPFFLKVSFKGPHAPYTPPQWYFDLYDRRELPTPVVGDWAGVHDVPAVDPDAWHGRLSDEQIHRARAGYYGAIHHIDHQIGRIMAALRRRRLDDDTLVVVTADHGDSLGDHHLWRKTHAYEGSAHIPFIVRPRAAQRDGLVGAVDRPVGLQDVMPTILDAVGADIPDTVTGASVMPLIRGEKTEWRPFLHGEHSLCYDPRQEMQYLVDGRWKYVWLPRVGAEQLFDLARDPGEIHDLAHDPAHQGDLQRWRAALVGILEKRDAGLTDDGRLVNQKGRPPLVSPHAAERRA
jgi:arylsulfatase A-like enzyme